jgi:hypothetical protein
MRGPIGPPFCCHLATATRQQSRIVRCLAPPSQACCAWPFHAALCRAAPSRPILALPHQATPATPDQSTPAPAVPCLRRRTPPDLAYQACHSLPSQTMPCLPFLAYLTRPCSRQISPSQPRLSVHTLPCLPIPAFLTMPAKPCGSSIAPGLATPCLPTPPFDATRSTPANRAQPDPAVYCHACQSEPVLQHLAMPAAPSTPDPAMPSLPLLPYRARPCPRGLARRALP